MFPNILGNQRLTDEILLTALTLIENILNSHKLTPVSEDPNDQEYLTSNHLPFGRVTLNLLPDVFAEHISTSISFHCSFEPVFFLLQSFHFFDDNIKVCIFGVICVFCVGVRDDIPFWIPPFPDETHGFAAIVCGCRVSFPVVRLSVVSIDKQPTGNYPNTSAYLIAIVIFSSFNLTRVEWQHF